MARPKKNAAVDDKKKNSYQLLEALRFISVAQHADGEPWQTHCKIQNGRITAYDGGLSAGIKIDNTELDVCPHTRTLIAALSRCSETVSISELDSGRLSVKSGKFRALVPCVEKETLGAPEPDYPCATLTESLKDALRAVAPFADDKANEYRPFTAAVYLGPQIVQATNGAIACQAYHGIDLPPDIHLPKPSALLIANHDKILTRFGFSLNSVTFYFEDESYIKTQLFAFDKYPDINRILDVANNQLPLPPGFWEALDMVEPFSTEGRVYFRNGAMHSDEEGVQNGASFEVEGLPNGIAFNIEYLKKLKPLVKTIDFKSEESKRSANIFFGENVRGAIMGIIVSGS